MSDRDDSPPPYSFVGSPSTTSSSSSTSSLSRNLSPSSSASSSTPSLAGSLSRSTSSTSSSSSYLSAALDHNSSRASSTSSTSSGSLASSTETMNRCPHRRRRCIVRTCGARSPGRVYRWCRCEVCREVGLDRDRRGQCRACRGLG